LDNSNNWPWIEITDDEQLKGVVWRFVGEIDMQDAEDGSGLMTYDIEVTEETYKLVKEWSLLETYTGNFVKRAIEEAITAEGIKTLENTLKDLEKEIYSD